MAEMARLGAGLGRDGQGWSARDGAGMRDGIQDARRHTAGKVASVRDCMRPSLRGGVEPPPLIVRFDRSVGLLAVLCLRPWFGLCVRLALRSLR